MKTLQLFIFLTLFICCSPAFAEYCAVDSESAEIACKFKTEYTPKDANILVSHTEQGWTLTVTVIQKKDFAMIAGDAKAQIKEGEIYNLEYVSTRRDIAPRRKHKEAALYLVNEEFLYELASTKSKVKFWLTAEDPKELELKFSWKLFRGIDDFIAETKTVLGDRFQGQ